MISVTVYVLKDMADSLNQVSENGLQWFVVYILSWWRELKKKQMWSQHVTPNMSVCLPCDELKHVTLKYKPGNY